MLFNFFSIHPYSHFASLENDIFRECKIKAFGKNDLKFKYNNKSI